MDISPDDVLPVLRDNTCDYVCKEPDETGSPQFLDPSPAGSGGHSAGGITGDFVGAVGSREEDGSSLNLQENQKSLMVYEDDR